MNFISKLRKSADEYIDLNSWREFKLSNLKFWKRTWYKYIVVDNINTKYHKVWLIRNSIFRNYGVVYTFKKNGVETTYCLKFKELDKEQFMKEDYMKYYSIFKKQYDIEFL
jgi:hypothetical protein